MSDELKVGDKLKHNDPRMMDGKRILTVVRVFDKCVVAADSIGRQFEYMRKRIFTDGKKRRYGLNRIDQ